MFNISDILLIVYKHVMQILQHIFSDKSPNFQSIKPRFDLNSQGNRGEEGLTLSRS